MESIVSGAKFLYEAALSQIQQQVVDKMKEAGVTPDAIMSVSSVFDGETQYTNVFRGLETTYHQNSFIKDHFRFVVCLLSSTCTTQYQCFYNRSICLCACVCVYVCACVHVCVCRSVHVSVCVCTCVCSMCACVCCVQLYMYLCACTCACVCVCARMCCYKYTGMVHLFVNGQCDMKPSTTI